jgi:integration host factor subunit beta
MNKSELIEALAQSEGMTMKKAESVVNTIFKTMTEALCRSDRV